MSLKPVYTLESGFIVFYATLTLKKAVFLKD
jgi:hypothetical protein